MKISARLTHESPISANERLKIKYKNGKVPSPLKEEGTKFLLWQTA